MLSYRILLSQRIASVANTQKLSSLLRSGQCRASFYSTLQCTTSASICVTQNALLRHNQERDLIRSSHQLFHTSPFFSKDLKDVPKETLSAAVQEKPQAVAKDASETIKVSEIPGFDAETQKLGLFARFKKMYKEYWYVLLPVHCITSAGWLTGFYYLSKSGFDVASLMESWNFNETIISHLRDSKLGHVAIAYFLYKCFTPIRYMLTLGGTTYAIKSLSRLGYIRPMPTKDALMKMYQDKKDSAKQAIKNKTHGGSTGI